MPSIEFRPRSVSQSFHFVLNVAVGGNFFWDDGCTNEYGKKPWTGFNQLGAMKKFWEAK